MVRFGYDRYNVWLLRDEAVNMPTFLGTYDTKDEAVKRIGRWREIHEREAVKSPRTYNVQTVLEPVEIVYTLRVGADGWVRKLWKWSRRVGM